MIRSRTAAVLVCFGFALLGASPAFAQQVRPPVKGRTHRVKVDSSPQQAAVYWAAGTGQPKDYGIAGYTPITLKVPHGAVTFVVELQGFKSQQKAMDVKKSQNIAFTLERAPAVAKLDLQSTSDGTATGADVTIDGVPRGTLPNAFEVAAGRHQIEVHKAGFRPWSQWFDLAEGEHHTHDVSLDKAEAPSGALLVTSDVGGDVYVDGVRKDVAPAIIQGVSAGDHVVEVRKEGAPPWRQNVTVVAGQQVKVTATFGSAVGDGSLRVIASEPDAQIFVDGEDHGHSPAVLPSIKPGDHIIEARKHGFKSVQQTIKVTSGENAVRNLVMEAAPADRPRGTLKIQSTIPNAEVFVDGSSLGRAPIDRNDLDPGKHYIVVHKDGYTDFKREIFLVENQTVALVADLSATGSLRALSTPEGADVRVDGELIGKTPVTRDSVAVGQHLVEVDLKGYFKHKDTIKVEGGRQYLYSTDLQPIPTGPSPEQVAKRKAGMSSFGAKVNPVGGVTVDFGAGYPYFLTIDATVGAFNVKPLGLDLGVQFQTFFQMYDFSAHARLQLLEAGPLSIAGRVNGGYGIGPDDRNSWFGDISPIVSLAFASVATVSASARWAFWSDQFCPPSDAVAAGVSQAEYCTDTTLAQNVFGSNPDRTRRFNGQRVLVGFAAVAALDRLTSLFLQMEFVPGLAPTSRPMFTDAINSNLAVHDSFVYGMGGISLKF
jgi:hypothetical protein